MKALFMDERSLRSAWSGGERITRAAPVFLTRNLDAAIRKMLRQKGISATEQFNDEASQQCPT